MSNDLAKAKFLNEKLPILYTVSPPKTENEIQTYLETLNPVFSNKKIHAISAPELNTRIEEGGKVVYRPDTIAPEDFLSKLNTKFDKITTIVAPRVLKKEFVPRLNYIKSKGINTAILVGPAKQEDVELLGGYTVQDGFEIATKNDFTCGGITIPWRKVPVPLSQNTKSIPEYERVALKQKHGCKFVTSQLVFEFESPVKLIYDYAAYCKDNNLNPLTLFFSFCVVPSERTLDFLYKLYVDIPAGQRFRLLNSQSIEKESVELACDIWGSILDAQRSSGKNVKVGLQIEQIKIGRVEQSLNLLNALLEIN